MARRRYRRYRRKSGRWASNIQEINQNITIQPDDPEDPLPGPFKHVETIMGNPSQQPSYVSQTFTVKNIEANFTIDAYPYPSLPALVTEVENLVAYIMFVPQGMTVTSNYNLEHPEYVMAYKYIGSPSAEYNISSTSSYSTSQGQQYQPYRIKTRLSRKLQSGDSVVLFVKGLATSNNVTNSNLRLSGLIRWWTKAN